MKTWAWILIGGGAFTAVAGWLAARAKAQTLSASLPAGVIVPPGTPLMAADIDLINSSFAQTQDAATFVTAANSQLALFAHYRSDYLSWVASTQAAAGGDTYHGTTISTYPQGQSFSQFVNVFH